MERVSCSDSCPGVVLAAEGGLPLRLQHAQCRSARRARPRRSSAACLRSGHSQADADRLSRRAERAARRKQSRSHAPHLQGRAGHLRLFVEGAARHARRPRCSSATSSPGGAARSASGRASAKLLALFAPVSMTVTAGSSDARSASRVSPRRLPFLPTTGCRRRRSSASCMQLLQSRHGRSADVPRPSRESTRRRSTGAVRRAPPVAKALAEIARDEARARALPRLRARCRSARARARMIALAERLGWLTPRRGASSSSR